MVPLSTAALPLRTLYTTALRLNPHSFNSLKWILQRLLGRLEASKYGASMSVNAEELLGYLVKCLEIHLNASNNSQNNVEPRL